MDFMPLIKNIAVEGVMRGLSSPPLNPAGLGLMLAAIPPAAIGLAFLAWSEYLVLQQYYTPELAALLTSLTALAVSGIICWSGYHVFRRDKYRPRRHNSEIAESIHAFIDTLAADLEEPIRDNPKLAVLLAGTAGFMAADRISGR